MPTYKDKVENLIELAEENDSDTIISDWEPMLTKENIELLVSSLNKNPKITTLSLQHCSLTNATAQPLINLKYIKTLCLSYNNITDATWIVNNTNIQDISLDNNNIQNTPKDFFSLDLSHIKTLAINNAGNNEIRASEEAIAQQIKSSASRRNSTASTEMDTSSNSSFSDSDSNRDSKTSSPSRL